MRALPKGANKRAGRRLQLGGCGPAMRFLRPRRFLWAALVVTVGAMGTATAGASAATFQAKAKSICVGSTPGCFSTIQAAVNAAQDGDTITIAPGIYSGGITVDVSVKIVGAGAGKTIISGGGPVITIGQIVAASEPTVSIDGVTITGGVTRSSQESVPCTGKEGVWAAGGGVEVPPATEFSGGAWNEFRGCATVTIIERVQH